MNRSRPRRFPRFPGQRLLMGTLPLTGALFAAGCGITADLVIERPAPPRHAAQAPQVHQTAKPHADVLNPPETLPAPADVEGGKRVVPISLDTVFHLAEEQNSQVSVTAKQRFHNFFLYCRWALRRLPAFTRLLYGAAA